MVHAKFARFIQKFNQMVGIVVKISVKVTVSSNTKEHVNNVNLMRDHQKIRSSVSIKNSLVNLDKSFLKKTKLVNAKHL